MVPMSSLRMTVLEIPAASLLAGPQDSGIPKIFLRQHEALFLRAQTGENSDAEHRATWADQNSQVHSH